MAETYDLIFIPKLRENADVTIVKQKLSKTLNVGIEKVEAWYQSGEPTTLLTEVSDDIADRYMKAILKCGASCNVRSNSTDDDGLSLIPKQFRTTDVFICPSCHHEEEVNIGEKLDKCPKCDLIIAKYEEKMKAEKEKDEIRLRMLREQRHQTDRTEDHDRKRNELDRLRALEREIMKELGIKPPSTLWVFFEKYAVILTFAMFIFTVGMTAITLALVEDFFRADELAEIAAAEPSEEVQQIAPAVTAALQLQQTGNVEMVEQLAQVSGGMQGQSSEANQQITAAAQAMLKGAGPEQFMKLVSTAGKMSASTVAAMGGAGAAKPMSFATMADIKNLPGVEQFDFQQIASMAPATMSHGPEQLMQVFSQKTVVADPANPTAAPTTYSLERLDGSMVINLMKEMNQHQAWDRYLLARQQELVDGNDIDKASELTNRIKDPSLKVQALRNIIVNRFEDDATSSMRIFASRVQIELDRIDDPDLKARVLLAFGQDMSAAGIDSEPNASLQKVEEMMEVEDDLHSKSNLAGRLAVAYHDHGNQGASKRYFKSAVSYAGNIKSKPERLSAFTRLAQRYYDVRNTTVGQQILSEAITLSVNLPAEQRAGSYAKIALAQGYMGDFPGAMLSVSNAGKIEAQQQVLSKLAEVLIDNDRLYQAISIMNDISDEVLYGQLQFRLVSSLISKGEEQTATQQLNNARLRSNNIMGIGKQSFLISQYAHLYNRLGQTDRADTLFTEAISLSEALDGRKEDVTRGFTAMEQARSFMIHKSYRTLAGVKNSMIHDTLESEITALERTGRIFFDHDEGPR